MEGGGSRRDRTKPCFGGQASPAVHGRGTPPHFRISAAGTLTTYISNISHWRPVLPHNSPRRRIHAWESIREWKKKLRFQVGLGEARNLELVAARRDFAVTRPLPARQFSGSYYSVKRFVRRFLESTPLPFRRMECEPGEEAQVDFGTGAPIVDADGKRRKTHVFRIVLTRVRRERTERALATAAGKVRLLPGRPQTVALPLAAVSPGDGTATGGSAIWSNMAVAQSTDSRFIDLPN
jgi:hypothetical protein